MTKINTLMNESLLTAKHTHVLAENRPGKAKRHRYERRRVREYLKIEAWREAFDNTHL